MNEYINPPCSSFLARSCIESVKASSSDEGKVATPFTEGVSSTAQWELAID